MYFVTRMTHRVSDGLYTIVVFPFGTENEALHQYHSDLTTYAYGNNINYDYVSAEIRTLDGSTIVGPEIDNRLPTPTPEPEASEVEG